MSGHMTPEEFRQWGHAMVDWLAAYQQRVESLPVLSRAAPGDVRAALPAHPPRQGEDFAAVLADLDRVIVPGLTQWQSPNFFAFFPSNNSGPSILAELLSAGLGVQGMLWATSPACTELETLVLDWLHEMLALPGGFHSSGAGGGVIHDTASSAVLCALLAARERASAGAGNRRGGELKLACYASSQAHSSIDKAVMVSGLGLERLRKIEVDAAFAMRPERLAAAIAADRAAGLTPAFVCATLGTTSSNAMDPLAALGPICREAGAWLHVDAAMSGTAALCDEFRHHFRGLEYADSFNFNPHKWMFTNFDCSCFWVRDRQALLGALSILPEYLRNQATESGAVIDYRDWQIPLGRRFRALKLWFVIRHYGVAGLQEAVRGHVALAREFAQWVAADPRFELAAPAPLNLVCFRLRAGAGAAEAAAEAANERLLARLNASGALYLTHTKLDGKFTLRFCIGQTQTGRQHVEAAWRRIQSEAGAAAAAV